MTVALYGYFFEKTRREPDERREPGDDGRARRRAALHAALQSTDVPLDDLAFTTTSAR